ncbi:MAG: hypothetical protein IKT25_04645, partial [Firmicutes bacterium]|nr:hypothetical protein [Bacillota bacterium]
ISYKTWEMEDLDLYYRAPAEGFAQGEGGHVVKGGYSEDGLWMTEGARTEAAFNTKEALENFIFVSTLCANPDGKAAMRRPNRYGFDLNRDAVYATQPETIAVVNDLMKWDPLVMNEWHGYVAQMLIEPCTAPHDPAYDYDLLQNNMINLSYAAGLAVTGSTGMQRFQVPWDHYNSGDWDDGGTIYAPMFAMLLGCYGFTVEFPYTNLDALNANDVVNYAMINELLHGETEFFPGNSLNGEMKDKDGNVYASHEEDIAYTSMKKSSLISKLETKARGISNVDAKESVDKYFIDNRNDEDIVIGRTRTTDGDGNERSYFPDYIVVPADDENQYNIAEAIKAINQMIGWNIKVSESTEDVTYEGTVIPAGAYVLDMKQARRNVIFETMGQGYDATEFEYMYCDIFCSLPEGRGFDRIQIYSDGLFEGKLTEVSSVEKFADISGEEAEYIVFKSQSTDAVRFVNLLLSGYSSGPSYSDKGEVWMLREAVDGVGSASDYVIKATDLAKINNLENNAGLGLNGCHIEGKYISALPEEAVKLVEPVIQVCASSSGLRTSQTGGLLWWMLDDYLGFNMEGYNGGTSLRTGANVIIANNTTLSSNVLAAAKEGTGVIMIRNVGALTQLDANIAKPANKLFTDVAIYGTYNVDNSLYTENYAATDTYYARGSVYTTVPEGAKVLFRSYEEDAFIGGFQATNGEKDVFNNAVTMFSMIVDVDGTPVQTLAIGQQLDNRSHYQKLLPMMATAIFANAAGILDDQNDPVISKPVFAEGEWTVEAAEPDLGVTESGLASLTVYNAAGEIIAASEGASVTFAAEDGAVIEVAAVDKAGNKTIVKYTLNAESTDDDVEPTPAEKVADLIAGAVTPEEVEEARKAYDALTAEEKAKVEN